VPLETPRWAWGSAIVRGILRLRPLIADENFAPDTER